MVEQDKHTYSTKDVMENVNKLFTLLKDEKIDPAVFLHSLIFASEFMIKNYGFIPKQVAEIRRQSRTVVDQLNAVPQTKTK